MMRALLDVNFLIAIIDEGHEHHRKAHEWWSANISDGWATCPLTENGMVRVMSQSGYKAPISATFAIDLLAEQISKSDHAFWADDISLRDNEWIDPDRILGPNQITDAYLLALAVKNGGRLATLDRSVSLRAVRGAEPRHMAVI
ncbi:MAG: TA system VapC family ribonuclease toxin [Xanthobacteraceae bacterium]